MSTTGDDLPENWSRAEDSDEQAGQYNAQRPIRYEHADGTEVNAQPTTTGAGDTDQDVWDLNVVRDDEGRGTVESVREGIEGRDTTIGTAREFMRAYNDHHETGDDPIADAARSLDE